MTTLNDDFNRSNQSNLGTATVGGTGQGWAWSNGDVEVAGSGQVDISSNQAVQLSATTFCAVRAETDLASNDNYAQADIVAYGGLSDGDTGERPAGAPAARRRRRVYINLDGRVHWFANEANARQYLEDQARDLTRRFEREAERIEAEVSEEQRDPAGALAPVDWRAIPIRIPKIVVDGNEELEALAREIETRFYAYLMFLEARRKQLQWEDELLLLS